MSYWRRSPQRDQMLLDEAAEGNLYCDRDRDLAPTFTSTRPGCTITPADHDQILRFVLQGVFFYERSGPHYFGVGRVLLTSAYAQTKATKPRKAVAS